MTFKFERTDEFTSLHPNIANYMSVFVENRIKALGEIENAINGDDFQKIRDICHGQLGVAASYKCFKLEEIILYIQNFARKEEMTPIVEVLPVFKDYLDQLKASV